MQRVVKCALIGGAVGIAAPIVLTIGNEALFVSKQVGSGTKIWDAVQVCAFERRWFPLYPRVIHAPGCKNKTTDSLQGILAMTTFLGALIGALSSHSFRNSDSSFSEKRIANRISRSDPASSSAPAITESTKESRPAIPTSSIKELVSTTSPPPIHKDPGEGLKGFDWGTVGKMSSAAAVVAGVGLIAVYITKNMGGNQIGDHSESHDEFGAKVAESSSARSQREQASSGALQVTFPNPCINREFGTEGAACMARNGFDTIGGWYVKFEGADGNGVEYQMAQYSSSRIYGYYADCANKVGYNRTHSGAIGGGVPMTERKVSFQVCRKYFF